MRLMQSKREPKSGCASAQDKEWWWLKKQPFRPGCPQVRWGSPQVGASPSGSTTGYRLRAQLQLQLARQKAIARLARG